VSNFPPLTFRNGRSTVRLCWDSANFRWLGALFPRPRASPAPISPGQPLCRRASVSCGKGSNSLWCVGTGRQDLFRPGSSTSDTFSGARPDVRVVGPSDAGDLCRGSSTPSAGRCCPSGAVFSSPIARHYGGAGYLWLPARRQTRSSAARAAFPWPLRLGTQMPTPFR